MNIYLFSAVMIYSYLLSIFCKNKKIIYVGTCFILILLAGFRGITVNDDTLVYMNYYLEVPTLKDFFKYNNNLFEVGYKVINMLLKTFDLNYRYLFLLTATISITLMFTSLLKYIKYLFFAVFIYITNLFVVNEMILMRNAISVAIIFYAIRYMKTDAKKYIVFICISCLFHKAAIVALIPMLMMKMNILKNKKIVYFIMILFFLIGRVDVLENLYDIFKGIFPEKLGYYFQYYDHVKGSYRRLVFSMPVFIFFIQNFKKYKDQYLFLESLSFLYFSILFHLFFIGNDAFLRITHIYYSTSIIILSDIYLYNTKHKLLFKFLISTLNLLLVFWTLRDGNLIRFCNF